MTNFTQTFGNSAVSPSYVAYASYSFGSNLTLVWPEFSYGNTNVAARFMSLTATAGSLNVFLPDATLVSTGYDLLVFNAGSNTFNVVSSTGAAIATITAGQTYYILNTSNATQSGTWQTLQFGVGTGSASAAALAGAGLLAAAGLLEVNLPPTVVTTSYTLATTARGTLQAWTGGSGTISLPSAAAAGNGFIFALTNDGSGSVTVLPNGGDQIDGASSSIFAQTQSAYIISSGTAWYTIGKGIANTFAVTLLNLNVAGSSNITETSAQAQNIIQQFTGLLTGNINVIVPNTVQLYVLYNNTTGPFTLTFKTASGTGIQISQGSNTIVYCDGTNIVPGFTAVIGNSLTLPVGSASAPTLNFTGSTTSGLYSSSANHVSITSQSTEVADFSAPASAVNYLTFGASATTNAVTIGSAGTDANIGITFAPQGSGAITIPAAILTGLPTSTTPATNDSSTRIATTAFVKAQVSSSSFSGNTVAGTNTITIGGTTPSNWTLTDGNVITFTPANFNTGSATLNILATGALPLKKISFAGVVNLAAEDLSPVLPMIAQYSAAGGYYLILNLVAYGTVQAVSTTQSITSANTYNTYVATTAVTLNIAQSILLPTYFYINIFAQAGAVTIGINGSDKINNGSAGVGLTMPQGTSGTLTTDSNGNLYLNGTSILLAAANTWTGIQTFNSNKLVASNLLLNGATSGTTTLQPTAIAGTTTLTLPAATDTLVGKATTDTLTNKTLTSPIISGGTIDNAVIGGTVAVAGKFAGTTGTALTVTTSNSTSGFAITDTGGNGANFLLTGNGGTTPKKYLRVINGNFQLLNDSYGDIFTITDAGALSELKSININAATGATNTGDVNITGKYRQNGVNTGILAWVNFTGSTGAIVSSFNIASVTRNGTGDYTIAFTNNATDANYLTMGGGLQNIADGVVISIKNGTTPSVSSFNINAFETANALGDPVKVYAMVIGN